MGIFAFVDRYGYEVDVMLLRCEALCNGERGVSPKPPPGTVARAWGDLRLLTDMD